MWFLKPTSLPTKGRRKKWANPFKATFSSWFQNSHVVSRVVQPFGSIPRKHSAVFFWRPECWHLAMWTNLSRWSLSFAWGVSCEQFCDKKEATGALGHGPAEEANVQINWNALLRQMAAQWGSWCIGCYDSSKPTSSTSGDVRVFQCFQFKQNPQKTKYKRTPEKWDSSLQKSGSARNASSRQENYRL